MMTGAIHPSPMFFKLVSNTKKLIHQIKLRAGA
jgi:hypothetical protein